MTERALLPALLALSAFVLLAGTLVGSTPLGLSDLLAVFAGGGDAGDRLVVLEIRLPRAACAFAVGLALGASGAALQGLLRNPLAEPGVLGVSATASLFATTTLYYGLAAVSPWFLPGAAILGACAATGVIALAAARTESVVTLILIGVGLASFAGASMSLLLNLAPHPFTLSDMIAWSLGSVANRSWQDLGFSAPFLIGGLFVLFAARRGLSVLTLGEEAASGAGLDLLRQRLLVVLGAGLATGASVALAGAIGFVGIVAPHLIRPLTGHDPARSVLPSALLAGIILVLADIGVRVLPTTNELKLGVVAALFGAPAFVFIAMRRSTLRA